MISTTTAVTAAAPTDATATSQRSSGPGAVDALRDASQGSVTSRRATPMHSVVVVATIANRPSVDTPATWVTVTERARLRIATRPWSATATIHRGRRARPRARADV